MTNIVSSRSKIQSESAQYRSAVSESLLQTIGASINYLIDERDTLRTDTDANTAGVAAVFSTSSVSVSTGGTLTTAADEIIILTHSSGGTGTATFKYTTAFGSVVTPTADPNVYTASNSSFLIIAPNSTVSCDLVSGTVVSFSGVRISF